VREQGERQEEGTIHGAEPPPLAVLAWRFQASHVHEWRCLDAQQAPRFQRRGFSAPVCNNSGSGMSRENGL